MTATGTGVTGSRPLAEVRVMGSREPWTARLDRTAMRIRFPSLRGRLLGAPAVLAGPLLLSAAAVLTFLLPSATELLEYDRTAILAGQVWRLVTGHWTHASLDHLGWDVLAFAVPGCAIAWRSRRLFWRVLWGSAAAIPAALLMAAPEWVTYRGLSGVDSALFVALAVMLWADPERRSDRWLGSVALALFGAKVAFETLTGTALFMGESAGHAVVPLAHLVGAGVGLAAATAHTGASRGGGSGSSSSS